jgi:signal transduction histidine kinase
MYEMVMRAGDTGTLEKSLGAAEEQSKRIMGDYSALLKLTEDNHNLHEAVVRSQREAMKGFGLMVEMRRSFAQTPELVLERYTMWKEARRHGTNVLNNDFSKLGKQQSDVSLQLLTLQAEKRKQMVQVFIALIVVDVVLFIGTALYLRNMIWRLAKVNDNTYRLASDRPLNPALSGDDEIARLDRTFHQMAAVMKDAEALKQEVVVMVTHDLRTPLATLQNIIEFLRSGNYGKLDAKGYEYLHVANRNVGRMANLVNDLLDVEKVKSGMMTLDLQSLELNDCFEAARELAGAFAEEAGVHIAVDKTDVLVNADQDRVTRVLANLIANAVKFSPRDSEVTVSARQDKQWIYTAVSDQGPGIPADQLAQIFEPFRQVEGAARQGKGGSGLGLTICRSIVELHGGKIWVESVPGKGSRFIFTLPAGD